MIGVPSIMSFADDTVKVVRSEYDHDYARSYVPTPEVKEELKKISGKLGDCLYDDYRREIDTLKPNVHIDNEIAILMAAEEDVKQSRRNLRRRARNICPSSGPTKEEEYELKYLNKQSLRKMYELEDFKRDFNTKPFVATEMVDLSFERIEDNIRKRQQALQNLRREIYEASVLQLAGYYAKAKELKETYTETSVVNLSNATKPDQTSKTNVEKSKHRPKSDEKMSERIPGTAEKMSKASPKNAMKKSTHDTKIKLEKPKRISRGSSESDTDGDDSYTNVMETYQAERLRFEKNLEIFSARLEEFVDSHRKIHEEEEVSIKPKKKQQTDVKIFKTVKADVKMVNSNIKAVQANVKMVDNNVKAVKADVKMIDNNVKSLKTDVEVLKSDVNTLKSDVNALKSNVKTVKADIQTAKAKVKTVKVVKSDVKLANDDVRPDVKTTKSEGKIVLQEKTKDAQRDRKQKRSSEKSDVTIVSQHDCQEKIQAQTVQEERRRKKKVFRLPREDIQAYVDSCDHERAEKRRPKKRKETSVSSISEVLDFPLNQEEENGGEVTMDIVMQELDKEENDGEVTMDIVMQELDKEEKDGEVTMDIVIKELDKEGSDVDVADELGEQPLWEEESDGEISKELVILPLPTLDPMPVYIDNFQASCVLTQLFSSRDDYDENFEADYVIPPYESERRIYTKQKKVYCHQNKPHTGQRRKIVHVAPQRR
ncbi:putative autophagy-related protein 11 [Ylistrum balloti]|uniref:putative autophagy-related protein 11 n=1 Tax=Ylistrum balloti TaxID=509963 RepID=UPI002905B7E8|nr:putative autophagy-related protein 11 [Ylistrum balloti]